MSASDTRHSSNSKNRMIATRIAAPPTITSTRSGSSPGLCRRCAAGSVARLDAATGSFATAGLADADDDADTDVAGSAPDAALSGKPLPAGASR